MKNYFIFKNNKGEGYHVPVLYALGIIFVIGLVLISIANEYEETIPAPAGVLGSAINYVENGQNFTIPVPLAPDIQFNFNFLSMFGTSFKTFVVNNLVAFSIIPTKILVPLIILILVGLIWIVKLILP